MDHAEEVVVGGYARGGPVDRIFHVVQVRSILPRVSWTRIDPPSPPHRLV